MSKSLFNLKQEEKINLLRTLFESSGQGILYINKNNQIIDANPAFYKLVEEDIDENTVHNFLEYYRDKERIRLSQDILPTVFQNRQWTGELVICTKHGKLIAVIENIFMLSHPPVADLIAIMITVITEQKEMQREIEIARKESEEANQAKTSFLTNMSHEIRTPMNAILGMTDLLLSTALNDKQQYFTQTIYNSGEKLLELIDDILDLSKIESGKLELDDVAFEIKTLISDTVKDLNPLAIKKDLGITYRFDPLIPDILRGDYSRIRQILINLISNAIKFTEAGSVTIDVELMYKDGKSATLKFNIIDTGIGILPEYKKLIFNRFSQTDDSSLRKFDGAGLGLSVCKHLVDLMGGEIGVEVPDQGSHFWFKLKLNVANALLRSEYKRVDKKEISEFDGFVSTNQKILCAEDDLVNQEVIKSILFTLGYSVTIVDNGIALIEAYLGDSWDLILMDCMMPEMDGYDATKKVRELEEQSGEPRIPIIALTAQAMKGNKEKCMTIGMDDYLTKPARASMLKEKLSYWLAHSQKHRFEKF